MATYAISSPADVELTMYLKIKYMVNSTSAGELISNNEHGMLWYYSTYLNKKVAQNSIQGQIMIRIIKSLRSCVWGIGKI